MTTMFENFNLLESRVLDTLEKTDLEKIKAILSKIKEPTICTGVGGSYVVSNFASKVLTSKNNCIAENCQPRDILHKNLEPYTNILCCSYSGENYGTTTALSDELKLKKFLLSAKKLPKINNLTYSSTIPLEESFISLAATLIPMSILLAFYLDNDLSIIKEILQTKQDYLVKVSKLYEIFSGYETSTASLFLESTLVESGIAIPIVHDKYEYCHGRSTTSYHNDSSAIYFTHYNPLDRKLLSEFPNYYHDIITINCAYCDSIVNEYYLTYKAMLLAKAIAVSQNKDLSIVDYSPLVKKLYYFRGEM